MSAERPKLRGLSEIYRYLRQNETPIYVITPTPFSLLGLDQWVGSLEFVNYFDIFDGQHPRCFVPSSDEPPEFKSMEDVANAVGSIVSLVLSLALGAVLLVPGGKPVSATSVTTPTMSTEVTR